jgi:hypothetical protein
VVGVIPTIAVVVLGALLAVLFPRWVTAVGVLLVAAEVGAV